jgi:GTP cyclohydrolase II
MIGLSIAEPKASVRDEVFVETKQGAVKFSTFEGLSDASEHVALSWGKNQSSTKVPLVRLHSECLTGDLFQSARCDCGDQLQEAVAKFEIEGGILLYLRQEGRGIGLYNKLSAYVLQDQGHDTYAANELLGHQKDERSYQSAAQMLLAMGLSKIRLLTNNPEKVSQLQKYGIHVESVVPTGRYLKPQNEAYLRAKVVVTGHAIDLVNQRTKQQEVI